MSARSITRIERLNGRYHALTPLEGAQLSGEITRASLGLGANGGGGTTRVGRVIICTPDKDLAGVWVGRASFNSIAARA
jgi:hypothetical protein